MYRHNAILGLLAQTSIHAGTGQHIGAIDLPIQREGHNGWPCIFGSAVKGALRTHAEQIKAGLVQGQGTDLSRPDEYRKQIQAAPEIALVFGPPTANASDHAGALIVTDARLLLFPVRSLTSQFKWVTCPDALARLLRDADWLQLNLGTFTVPQVQDDANTSRALIPIQVPAENLFLEEYRFATAATDLSAPIDTLAALMRRAAVAEDLTRQLVIVSNDSFAHLVQHATPVNAHIAIDSQTKTVQDGALWYEETLPPETLLYTCLSATAARSANADFDPKQILGLVTNLFTQRSWSPTRR